MKLTSNHNHEQVHTDQQCSYSFHIGSLGEVKLCDLAIFKGSCFRFVVLSSISTITYYLLNKLRRGLAWMSSASAAFEIFIFYPYNFKPMKTIIVLLILAIVISAEWKTTGFKPLRKFLFKNQCQQTIWVGGFGVPLLIQTGWQMDAGTQKQLMVDSNTVAIRFWARTGCKYTPDNKFVCQTGDCGAPLNNFGVECKGITGQSPSTLIQLTLSGTGNPDFYDLSNVDGHNLGVKFGPIQGTYIKVDNPDLGKFNCGSPGCSINQDLCPPELTLQKSTGNYCMSICAAVYNSDQVKKYPDILGPIASDDMKKDLVCCACGAGTGGCTDPNSHYCCSPLDPREGIGGRCYVEEWPKPSQYFDRYDKVFKDQCKDAYSWQFDDISSTYQCIDGDYEVVFCP